MDVRGGSEAKKALENYSDFIIIGGGSAGSVLANRLTANGRVSVTLIEAGRTSHDLSTIPISFAKFFSNLFDTSRLTTKVSGNQIDSDTGIRKSFATAQI
mgnify:CR=1 FL=1